MSNLISETQTPAKLAFSFFVKRPVQEVVASQIKMLQRQDRTQRAKTEYLEAIECEEAEIPQ